VRGYVPGLIHPHPLGLGLPAVYQEDEFAQRLCEGLDDVTAPIIASLDCLDAYFDPLLAPEDFLQWLATWVAAALDEDWPIERRRLLVGSAVDLYGRRGTVAGVRGAIWLYTGVEPEIVDSGATTWSLSPGSPVGGSDQPEMVVRIHLEGVSESQQRRLDRIVADTKPAHVPHRLEVVS
jgi:phage tail-like protein